MKVMITVRGKTGTRLNIALFTYALRISVLLTIIILSFPSISTSQTASGVSQKISVLILDPYSVDVKIATSVHNYLKEFNNVAITYLNGTEVIPEVFENLGGYDVIYYSGHGKASKISDRLSIGTGQLYSEIKEREYQKRYGSNYKRYLYSNSPLVKPEQTTFWITSDFIRDFSKRLKATVVYFDACDTLKKKTMAEAFISNGAKSYIGWNKGHFAWDIGNWEPTAKVAKTFLGNLLNCKTIESSFNDLPYDFNWSNLKWYGDGKAKLPLCLGQGLASGITDVPPIPYEDYGACPFECCAYREWIVLKDTPTYKYRDNNSVVVFKVKAGERVTAETGVVVTIIPGKVRVLKDTSLMNLGQVRKSDVIYLLTSLGEGYWRVWYKGKLYITTFPIITQPGREWMIEESKDFILIQENRSIWWVKIINNRGQIGWSDEPDNFDKKDECG